MRIYISTLIFLTMLSFNALSYNVVIEGQIAPNGLVTAVSNIQILVQSLPTDSFQFKQILTTDDFGNFRLVVEVPDSEEGTFLVSLFDCETTDQIKRVVYHPNHREFEVKLKPCQRDATCGVKIERRNQDAGGIILYAKARGEEPFSYIWSDGSMVPEIEIMEGGTYCVTITDADGCRADACIQLGKECKTKIVSRPVDPSTSNDIWAVLIAESRGEAPFTYNWSNGETTKEIGIGMPGNYCVRVVDALGCVSEDCIDIGNDECNTRIKMVPANTDASTATIHLQARSEGKAPFKYLWSTGDTEATIRVSEFGAYCVRVEDAAGCVSEDCITVDLSDCITEIVKLPMTDASSFDAVHLQARTSGFAPFTYMWSTGDSTKNIKVSESGTYCIRVVDSHGCVSEDCLDVELATRCAVEIKAEAAQNASSTNTVIELHARAKGHAPFTYKWVTENGDIISEEAAIRVDDLETYCVIVTDALGCTSDACINLAERARECSVKIHRTGSGMLIALTRSIFPYTILWSNGATERKISVSEPGEYCVTITTSTGCSSTDCITVEEILSCQVKIKREKLDNGKWSLKAIVRDSDKVDFQWSSGETSETIYPEVDGEYCVTVTTEDCSKEACIQFNGSENAASPSGFNADRGEAVKAILSPNPFIDEITIALDLDQPSHIQVIIYDLAGNLIRHRLWDSRRSVHEQIPLGDLHAGFYMVKVVTDFEQKTIRLVKSD